MSGVSKQPVLPFALAAAAIIVLTGLVIKIVVIEQRQSEITRLQTIVHYKSAEIASWIRERKRDVQYLRVNRNLHAELRRWRESGDAAAAENVQIELLRWSQNQEFNAITLLEGADERLWGSISAPAEIAPPLAEAVRHLMPGEVRMVGPYRDQQDRPRLDFVTGLDMAGGEAVQVVVHIDPEDWLYKSLQTWSVSSETGEMPLFRRDGDEVQFLNELRLGNDTALKLRAPLGEPGLLAAQVLRGAIGPDAVLRGVDYRGVPVVGVTSYVPGTDWHLIAKMDRSELYGQAYAIAFWIALVGLLALGMASASYYLRRQAQKLWLTTAVQHSEIDRLRALRLLAAIADSSDDAIYAKDLEGRYVLFNEAASRLAGKPVAEVLGHDDREICSPEEAGRRCDEDRRLLAGRRTEVGEEIVNLPGGERVLLTTRGPLRDREDAVIGTFSISRDITDLKQAEAALREKDVLLRHTSSIAHIGGWVFDPLTGKGAWTDEMERILEVEGQGGEISMEYGLGFFHGENRKRLEAALEDASEYASSSDLELQMVTGKGEEKWVRVLCSPVVEDGTVVAVRGAVQDITGRKQAEIALRESVDLIQLVVENVPVRVFWKDRQLNYLGCNTRFAQDVGYGYSDELIGKTDYDLSWKDNAELYRADDTAIMASGIARINIEEPQTTPDGDSKWLRSSKVPLRDDSGEVIGILGIYEDITDAKQAEQQLRKLAQAVEQSLESIIITDLQARIEYVNESFLRSTGYSKAEVLGKTPGMLSSGKTPGRTFTELWAALNNGEGWKGEFINRRKDGSEYVEFSIISPIREPDGSVTHYLAVQEDITEKKRLGKELDRHRHHLEELVASRTAELEEAKLQADASSQAKSAFLANMSHEIRTPMNAIIGLSYLMRQEDLTPGQRDRMNKVDSAAQHLLAIINDILDLSKIEAGRIELETTDFKPLALLEEASAIMAAEARRKGLVLAVECRDMPEYLHGDHTRLRQSLINYLGNAIKFTEQGSVTLRAGVVSDDDSGVLVRFEVQDTGIGIDADVLPNLFQSFSQADASTTRKYGGTGLGLAITRHLAELMGGAAGAESSPGQGSTFWFTACLGHAREVQPDAGWATGERVEDILRRHCGGARLLLAEDNPVNREVAVELLKDVGLDVDTAEDGRIALEKIRHNGYDLVLMDVQMPEMDGLTATRLLRADPATAELPILAMTANAFGDDRRACLDAGMNDFVSKPVVPEVLYRSLLRLLPQHAGDDQAQQPDGRAVVQPRETAEAAETPAPPVTSTGSVRSQLAALPGLDLDAGLGVVKGDDEKYLRLLRMFLQSHSEDMGKLKTLLDQQDRATAQRLAHTLKGVAATLGVKRVAELAAQLDTLLRNGADPAECTDPIQQCAEELARLVQPVAAINTPARTGSPE